MAVQLSIIIVNWNLKEQLGACLDSITSLKDFLTVEVIVVDNASSDGSGEFVKERYPGVRVIEMAENVGFSPANNCGYRSSRGEYLLFLNPDTRVPGGVLDGLVTYLRERPVAGVLGPRLRGDEGQLEISWGRDPCLISELSQSLKVGVAAGRSVWRRRAECISSPMVVHWVTGAFMVVRRKAFEEAGGFDERFIMYFEDCDLCRRIRNAGYEVVYYPLVEAFHSRGMARSRDLERVEWERRRGEILYYWKYNGWLQQSVLRAYLLLKFSVKAFLLSVGRFKGEEREKGLYFARKVCLLALRGIGP